MTLSFMNNKGYIFIVRRLGKQSKLILSRLDSISNLKLNLRIHGPCGPDAHAGADLQVFLIFCFKPILLSAHKLILLIYGDNNFLQMKMNISHNYTCLRHGQLSALMNIIENYLWSQVACSPIVTLPLTQAIFGVGSSLI